ncbi:MAG: hypothetical protein KF681_10550 [Bdellovibrionaceae bacterium]|nr:hypothetical protein [Pseudobdellovibrionaceae bacterium]
MSLTPTQILRATVGAALSIWVAMQLLVSFEQSSRRQVFPEAFRSSNFVLRSLSLAERWTMFCPDVSRTCTKSFYVLVKQDDSEEVKRFDFVGRAGDVAWDPWDFDRFSMLLLRTGDRKKMEPLYQDFSKWILKKVDPDFRHKRYRLRFIRDEIAIPAPAQFVAQDDVLKLPSRPILVREVQVAPSE